MALDAATPLDVVEIVLRKGGGSLGEVVNDASVDIWLNMRRLLRLATASSARRLEKRTGDGGVGATGSGGGGAGSSDREGEILRSPALSLLMLLSPMLYIIQSLKNKITNNV